MRNVQCVSFPRSGHHLLVRLLLRYFAGDPGLRIDPSEVHKFSHSAQGEVSFGYCELYGGCGKVPCPHPSVRFQKNHDFGLQLQPEERLTYLIQVREPLPALASYYRMEVEHFSKESAWSDFLKENLEFHRGFVRKWLNPGLRPKPLILPYEELTRDLPGALVRTLLHCDPDMAVDHALVAEVVRRADRDPIHDLGGRRAYFESLADLDSELRSQTCAEYRAALQAADVFRAGEAQL